MVQVVGEMEAEVSESKTPKAVKKYEYGRVFMLERSLQSAGIAPEIVTQIMEGGDAIRQNMKPVLKADWMAEAMRRMDRLLDKETRHAVRESCACCLTGKRLNISKAIRRENATLEDRIRAVNEAKYVCGHSVTMQEDGRVLVCFSPEGLSEYRCVCLPKAREPVSITYCYCCGGHAKHHLQTALGRKLKLEVRSSALESGGKKPCTFLFTFEDG